MKTRPDQLLKVILIFTAVTMLAVWLPLIRGVMDGPSYEWGSSFLGKDFGGHGVAGDYWFVVAQALIALAIIYFGWRGARQPFHWLLLLWLGSSLVNAIYNAVKFPDDYRFKGDTMGLDVSLTWIAPLFWFVLTLLAIVWIVRDLRERTTQVMPPWTGRNTILMVLVFAVMPVQFYLLRSGGPGDLKDQQGVVLTIAQWILLNFAFASKRVQE
ncbi:MAG TPA: hypothetical protein VFD63_01440 [Pyrinomonadaceae bacterium]|nr:hypothetical protein [Pyrinomonadaceae bacterium]